MIRYDMIYLAQATNAMANLLNLVLRASRHWGYYNRIEEVTATLMVMLMHIKCSILTQLRGCREQMLQLFLSFLYQKGHLQGLELFYSRFCAILVQNLHSNLALYFELERHGGFTSAYVVSLPSISSVHQKLSPLSSVCKHNRQRRSICQVMAGGRRKRMQKSVAETVGEKRSVSSKSNDPNADPRLPTELLELIFSKLNLRDNIRASSVCKSWLAVAVCLREPNKAPWLMSFPKSGNWYQFLDPSGRRIYYAEYPELRGSRICYAKDGWLLAFKPNTRRILFFHPYTREVIKLPKRQSALDNVAFSAAPTSQACVLFTMKSVAPTVVAISTTHPGAAAWTTMTFHNHLPFISSIWNKVVFSKGFFYCLSLNGMLGVFDPEKDAWTVTHVPPPKCTEHLSVEHWRKGKFMAEHDGDIFVVYTCANLAPFVYKLDEERGVWVETGCLGGVTLFANALSCAAKSSFHGRMRNSVYFSKVIFYGRRCIMYSLDSGRYYPVKRFYDWGCEDAFQSIWIDLPQDFSLLLQG